MVDIKYLKSNLGFDSNSEPNVAVIDTGMWIIDVKPGVSITTTNIYHGDPSEMEEGKHLFHPHMWVKGNQQHFIVDSEIQKNLMLTYLIKWLNLKK